MSIKISPIVVNPDGSIDVVAHNQEAIAFCKGLGGVEFTGFHLDASHKDTVMQTYGQSIYDGLADDGITAFTGKEFKPNLEDSGYDD